MPAATAALVPGSLLPPASLPPRPSLPPRASLTPRPLGSFVRRGASALTRVMAKVPLRTKGWGPGARGSGTVWRGVRGRVNVTERT